jgi:hypothetical protein
MPGKYAAGTQVSSEESVAEIQRTLRRYNAQSFMYGYEGTTARVGFKLSALTILIELSLPDPDDRELTLTPTTRRPRSPESRRDAYEQAVRQRWRALALVVKAKLEAVDSGISTVEKEFLSFIVTADGRTVGERVIPQLAAGREITADG